MDADAWRQAKGVLAGALACPPSEREAFVDARCDDPALRRELQSYLNHYDEDFLESVLTVSEAFDTTAGGDDAAKLPEVVAGDRIGPYVVLDRLGVGGMGHVFLGNDTRLQRKVALKCLSAPVSASELRTRILHEARAAARVTHPNIAIVHDVVEHENRPFLVMEYVEGESLAALIKRERPPVERIITMLRQLASALAAAHGKGIVHRDLKPANIQVTPDGSVKILDFGVAHAISAAASGLSDSGLTVRLSTTSVSNERRVMHPGTPAYMSPEQMFGREIDQRSDIYSLGVIVYEMATGRRPYATHDPFEVVLTLSKNFLGADAAQAGLPARLNDIVARMLAVKPQDRYQTAIEIESALAVLTEREHVAPAPSAQSKVRVALRVVAVVACVAVGVTALGYLETEAFNRTLGRTPPFDHEPPILWVKYGLQSLFLPTLFLIAFFVVLWAVKFVVRMLRLSRSVDHLLTDGATRTTSLSLKLGLDDPAVFGQAVAVAGLVALIAVVVHFLPFMRTWMTTVSIGSRPASELVLLQTGPPRISAYWYKAALMLLLFAFGAAILRLQRLRARPSMQQGQAALALVSALAVTTLVLDAWPYRILIKSSMPRVDVAGERCFILGEAGEQLLIHCPGRTPPNRNSVVRSADPAVHRLGVNENLFDPPKQSP